MVKPQTHQKYPQEKIILDQKFHDWSRYDVEEYDWDEFYPDAKEELPPNMPEPWGKPVQITSYKDADHAHAQVTRRSVTGILLFINNTPIAEQIMEYRYGLHMMGVPLNGPLLMLGDNNSMVVNTTIPSSP